MIDSLNGLFANFVNRETQAVIDKGLELGRYAGNGSGVPRRLTTPSANCFGMERGFS